MVKAQSKEINKTTLTRSTTPGERALVDLTGPFPTSLGRSRYWMQIVDNATQIGFAYFMQTKDQIAQRLELFVKQASDFVHNVAIICCNNSGENVKHVKGFALNRKMLVKFTSPYTPQFNRVVERQIAVLKLQSQAMLTQTAILYVARYQF